MTFQLDATGEVMLTIAEGIPAEIAGGHFYSDLSPFMQGYIEALFAALDVGLRRDPGRYLDGGENVEYIGEELAFFDLAPETLARIIADCEAWKDPTGQKTAGEALWRVRQRGELAAVGFPPLTVQLGDGGKVVFA